jgi:hypothetical protein
MTWITCCWRLAAGVSALAMATAARAADAPADAAGAKTIADFIAAYAGQAAVPSVEVKQDGASYLVSIDIGAATSQLKSGGFAYDPARVNFRVFKQDDGQWRVELAQFPTLTGHMTDQDGQQMDIRVESEDLSQVWLLDPKIDWLASSHGKSSKVAVTAHGPKVEEVIETRDIKIDAQTTSGPQGLTMTAQEPIGHFNFAIDVDPKGVDPKTGGPAKPVHVSANGEQVEGTASLANFQPGPLLDTWRFAAAHPTRADYARDFAGLKTVLTGLLADPVAFDEKVKLAKLGVLTESGPISFDGAAIGVGATYAPGGSGITESFSAQSLKLPDGLVPPAYASLMPLAFDVSVKASGFDVAAAVQEWMADAKLDGTGPVLSPDDQKKVNMKLWAYRPVVVEIAPSHFVSPSYDVTIEGKIIIDKGSPTASVTLKAKNFDQTAEAIESAAPDQAQQMTPVIAMAKGLGRAQPDGSLVWVYTLGADKVMKVNGLPLGKSPY